MIRMIACLAAVLLAGAVCAATVQEEGTYPHHLPESALKILKDAQTLTLYSLDPDPRYNDKDAFHDVHVLGLVELKGAQREKLHKAIEKGVGEDKLEVQACFNPRHGIRAIHDGKTVDLVVCFQCLKVKIFMPGGEQATYAAMGRSPQSEFDKLLTDAKVKLAPKAK